jgi:outer membrane lipoprotein-sorting protein
VRSLFIPNRPLQRIIHACAGGFLSLCAGTATISSQQVDSALLIQKIDAAVQARAEDVLSFTDVEHYVVFRGDDETHAAAEMTVTDTYHKGVGKSYTILSESGSAIILKFGLHPLLDNEQEINQPGNVEKSWFVSANYDMKLKQLGTVSLNGRDCYVVDIKAKRKAPNAIDGSIWVDARDGTLAQIDGVATESASALSGAAHMMREYVNVNGYSMARHARAESTSMLFGRTVVVIDYSDYQLQLKGAK